MSAGLVHYMQRENGKMLQVLKKDVFPFSQFISIFIVLQAVSILSHLPTIPCSPYGECLLLANYLPSECPSFYLSSSRFLMRTFPQSFPTELLTSHAIVRACSAVAIVGSQPLHPTRRSSSLRPVLFTSAPPASNIVPPM